MGGYEEIYAPNIFTFLLEKLPITHEGHLVLDSGVWEPDCCMLYAGICCVFIFAWFCMTVHCGKQFLQFMISVFTCNLPYRLSCFLRYTTQFNDVA